MAIISDGCISGYFVSERDYQKLQRLRNFERRVYRLERLPAAIAEAIEASAMDPKHDHLNALVDHE